MVTSSLTLVVNFWADANFARGIGLNFFRTLGFGYKLILELYIGRIMKDWLGIPLDCLSETEQSIVLLFDFSV